ncbi:cupin domain-containing protein [Amycolatopsis sp. WQ 127309]|uniref:cupin domain-containing protein n=1 Tax=Amycolatopsis sp. WQ 127309 TaxID=2932773 RepID=UPI001FF6108F|nr:cupin domain-containing protein [Amycolatopsis sp. WQ 127309]UOZ06962.1 cupin domain-containing protein [Amycolatopsis sp. WQ 127309]
MLAPGGGEDVGAIGLGMFVKLTGADTGGAYSLFEYTAPPGLGGPPTHVHTREDELFVCTAGAVTVELGGERHVLTPGAALLTPRGVPHMFFNEGTVEARIIAVVSPPGLENYYRDLNALPPGPRDMTKVAEVMRKHGLSLVGPGTDGPDAARDEPAPPRAEQVVRRMCAAVDEHDFAGFGAFFAEDARYRFGSGAPVRGRAAIVAATAAAAAALPTARHRVEQVAEIGRQLFCRFVIEVETPRGAVEMPCVTVIELATGGTGEGFPEIVDYRVHMDVSPVLAN